MTFLFKYYFMQNIFKWVDNKKPFMKYWLNTNNIGKCIYWNAYAFDFYFCILEIV